MSEMSQAQSPDTGAGGSDPLSGDVSEVADNLDEVDQTPSDSPSSGGVQPQDPEEDGLLTADVGGDRNAPSEGGHLSEPGDPDNSSGPLPDIAGTGS